MSIATQITALQTDKTNISNAITTMGGSVTSGDGFDNFAADILTIPQGGGSVITPKDVNFYDYDGTVLYAYTLAEAQALTALPELPEGPSGYTASSWTENLTTVKNLTHPFNIGVNYTTSKTGAEFDIVIGEEKEIYGYANIWHRINWGDGTTSSTYGLIKHTYAQSGEYTVTVTNSSNLSLTGAFANPWTGESTREGQAPMLMFCSEAYVYKASSFKGSSLVRRIRINQNIDYANFCYKLLESVLFGYQITSTPTNMFRNASLSHVTIPSSITTIKSNVFENCGIQSIIVPSSVTSIGQQAFYSCKSLISITIPDSVTNIGTQAFYGCSGLKSITVGNSVTSIGRDTFTNCLSLTSITIPNSVTSIGYSAFSTCSSLTSITIPNSVTSIGDYAFYNCLGLKSITVGNSVTSIGSYVFSYCELLQSVTILSNITKINSQAFYGCYDLLSITIPSSVTSIDSYAFYNCNYLNEVKVLATTPPALQGGVFDNNYSTRKIYVPYSADHSILNAYKTANNWSNYANYIEELPEN